MSLRVSLGDTKALEELLSATEKEVARAQRNACNRTATAVRRMLAARIQAGTGLPDAFVRGRIRIYRAGGNFGDAKVVPSSAGVPVDRYVWRFVPQPKVMSRATIFVRWFGGEKPAAGFVNPLGKRQAPLRTYSKREGRPGKSGTSRAAVAYVYKTEKPESALGPSVAAAARVVIDDAFLAETQALLASHFEKALANQVEKGDESD